MKFATLLTCLTLLIASSASAMPKIGAVGDSLIDEHFDQSGFGTSLGYSKNGLELIVGSGQMDAGPLGIWGGTRGSGFEYNWALAGSTTDSLLAGNQHTNLANQIASEGITKAVMIVGSNNLFPTPPSSGFSAYQSIYTGLATPAEISSVANQAIANVISAAQAIVATGVDLIVATAPDYGIAPFTKAIYPDPAKRELVDDVIEFWNAEAASQLTSVVGVPVADIYSLTKDIWGDHGTENATLELGGANLNLSGTGGVDLNDVLNATYDTSAVTSDTLDAFVHDGIHPNTAIGGIFANLFLTTFNRAYGDNFALFSEQEILLNGGPILGALYTADTLQNSLGGKIYGDYVILSGVPEPSTWLLGALASLGVLRRRSK